MATNTSNRAVSAPIVMLTVGLIVFLACMAGILSRPVGHLSALWPANAMLLGVMVRFPRYQTWSGWLGAALAFFAADLVTGNSLFSTLLLTTANFAGVLTGYILFRRLHATHRGLANPMSVPYLTIMSLAASCASGLVGTVADPLLFNGTALNGLTFWFVTELVNYLAILPMVLSWPEWRKNGTDSSSASDSALPFAHALPAIAFVASLVLGFLMGGVGAIAIPLPALLWCAFRYGVFTTAVLTFVYSAWTLIGISSGYLPILATDTHSRPMLLSIRAGIALLALIPITIASMMTARETNLPDVRTMSEQDPLTGLLSRHAFYAQATALLDVQSVNAHPSALLLLELDKFNSINDTYSEVAGDRALKEFAAAVNRNLGEKDVSGRTGDGEFAALLPDCSLEQANAVAQRICQSVANNSIKLDDVTQLRLTVSGGLAFSINSASGLDAMLAAAHRALEAAKDSGRNCVRSALVDTSR